VYWHLRCAKKRGDVDDEHLERAIVIVADLRETNEKVMETGSVGDPS
jgi:hypothetical protein